MKSTETIYNWKQKKHTIRMPAEGYLVRAVKKFYPGIKDKKHDDLQFVAAVKFGKLAMHSNP